MLEKDFNKENAEKLSRELYLFEDYCHYDIHIKKIIYNNPLAAMFAYTVMQTEEMLIHKWIESQKRDTDLGDKAVMDWVKKHAANYSDFWRRTHLFIA